jgi:hypothetical protein
METPTGDSNAGNSDAIDRHVSPLATAAWHERLVVLIAARIEERYAGG